MGILVNHERVDSTCHHRRCQNQTITEQIAVAEEEINSEWAGNYLLSQDIFSEKVVIANRLQDRGFLAK